MDNTDPPKKKRGRPRKEKAPKEKKPRGRPRKTQSQKQKQSQNVKVIVNAPAAPKRRYRRKPAAQAMPAMPQMLPIPPRVIEVPVPVPFEKPSSAPVVVPSVAKKEVGTDTMIPVAESAGMDVPESVSSRRSVSLEPPKRMGVVDQPSPRITEPSVSRKSSMYDNINNNRSVGVSDSESDSTIQSGASVAVASPKKSASILSDMKPNNVMMDNVSAPDVAEDAGYEPDVPKRKKTAPENIGMYGPKEKSVFKYAAIKMGAPKQLTASEIADWKQKLIKDAEDESIIRGRTITTGEFVKKLEKQYEKATNISMAPPEKRPPKKKTGVQTLATSAAAAADESGMESDAPWPSASVYS